MLIEGQQHPRRKILTSKLSALKGKTWTKELDMYSDVIGAIRDGLYKETKDIVVVDTSQRNDFHASVAEVWFSPVFPYFCLNREPN